MNYSNTFLNQENNILYHGTHTKVHGKFKPSISIHGKPWIYATPFKEFALCYSGNKWNDLMINQSYYNNQLCLTEIINGSFDKIFNTDGYIYSFNKTDFYPINNSSINRKIIREYYSDRPIEAINEEYIKNIYKELEKSNIKLFKYPELPSFIKNRKEYMKTSADIIYQATGDKSIYNLISL